MAETARFRLAWSRCGNYPFSRVNHSVLRHIPGARRWIKEIERLQAERDRLALRLEELELHRAALAKPLPDPRREEYKHVWTQLSSTKSSAKLHVGGFEEEVHFETTGRETKAALVSTVGLRPSDIVVEIGCGVGRVGKVIASSCQKWIGCDVSPNMLRFADERLQGLGNTELCEVNGYDLQPLPSESADVVYSTVVFMHLEEWDRYNYVLEAQRVLRPGGRIYIDNFNLCSDGGWQVFDIHRRFAPRDRPPHISKSSTPSELITYLQRAGFSGIQSRESGAWIQVWGVK